jgi:ABC-type transporter Mla maintaining outer membrane lipid asymmetry ATPase subunit MlaF
MRDVSVGTMRDPSIVATEQINWTVTAGDFWVVGGLQGAGKSDFLLMTAGLMAPARGDYRLFGEPMPIFEDSRLPQRLRLGLVFDGGRLFNQLTVWENVALPLRYHRNLSPAEAQGEVQPLLEAMELATRAQSTPGALGRNWHKRVGLARALILKPEVLLLDSPLSGLDLPHLNWWLGFMEQLSRGHPLLQSRPITLVVTAADLRPWKGHARQLAVLRDRQLVVLGPWPQPGSGTDLFVQQLLPE